MFSTKNSKTDHLTLIFRRLVVPFISTTTADCSYVFTPLIFHFFGYVGVLGGSEVEVLTNLAMVPALWCVTLATIDVSDFSEERFTRGTSYITF